MTTNRNVASTAHQMNRRLTLLNLLSILMIPIHPCIRRSPIVSHLAGIALWSVVKQKD